jgi:hypothetical protein
MPSLPRGHLLIYSNSPQVFRNNLGKAAEGVGKGAGDLVTLHPAGAAENVGKGAGVAGKDVGVGTAKGTGKIAKGTGRGIGKIFHHGHHDDTAPPPSNPQD